MAANRGVFLTGYKELDRKLAIVEPTIQKKVARKSLRSAGKAIQQAAQGNLARNDTIDTGELEQGIRVRAMKRSRRRIGVEVLTTERREGQSYGGKKFGGAQIETGTKHVRAKPFLRPAGYENAKFIETEIINGILSGLSDLTVL